MFCLGGRDYVLLLEGPIKAFLWRDWLDFMWSVAVFGTCLKECFGPSQDNDHGSMSFAITRKH